MGKGSYPIPHPTPYHNALGTDQTDTLPTDPAEMDHLASSVAAEKSPSAPRDAGADENQKLYQEQKLCREKTLILGEPDPDHVSTETLDYNELHKKVGGSLHVWIVD